MYAQYGRSGSVELAGVPLRYEPRSYKVITPDRFGNKVSTGDLRYSDFAPYEQADSQSRFDGGYGLARQDDIADTQQAHAMTKECHNVDPSLGVAILSPRQDAETLPSNTAPVTWLGEYTPTTGTLAGLTQWVAVAGTRVYTRNSDATWTFRFAWGAAALQNAVGVFGGKLIAGFGGAAAAQYTTDLATPNTVTNDAGSPAPVYAYAFTSDRSAALIAGGTAAGDYYKVLSSLNGSVFAQASSTPCGSSDSSITCLAPGGDAALVFVGKQTELGMITPGGEYRTLIPYDQRSGQNNLLRWWLSTGADEQRGPLVLIFARDGEWWTFAPQSAQAQNITPWAQFGLRPPNVRGRPTAFYGTARFMYIAIVRTDGIAYLLKRDVRTGVTHGAWMDFQSNACFAMGVTSLFDPNPLFFAGKGLGVISAILPREGDDPTADANCRYCASGTIDPPDTSWNFPDENKVLFADRIVADNLVDPSTLITAQYALDGDDLAPLGRAYASPLSEIPYDYPQPSCKRLSRRYTLSTSQSSRTPILNAISARASINPKLYRLWQFQALVPAGQSFLPGDDLQNPHTLIGNLWGAFAAGTPVLFKDRWGDRIIVRILNMEEDGAGHEPNRAPETLLSFVLEEVSPAVPTPIETTFTMPAWTLGWFPFQFEAVTGSTQTGWPKLGPGALEVTARNPNGGTSTIYPTWTLVGPGVNPVLTLVSSPGGTWSLNHVLGAGEIVTVQMNPVKRTVLDQDGNDLSGLASGPYWGFPPGDSTFSVNMWGTTSNSRIVCTRSPA